MAGTVRVIDTASAIVADRNVKVSGSGAHSAVNFYVDVSAITRTTGTLTVTVRWNTPITGTDVDVATVTGLTATGVTRLTPTANVFNLVTQAIPEPTEVLWDLVGDATAVSGTIIAIYGD